MRQGTPWKFIVFLPSLILSSFICTGCSASRPMQSFFPGPETKFDLQDTITGNLTHFEITPISSGACETGNMLRTITTKDIASAYWAAGLPGAYDIGALKQEPDGSWLAVGAELHHDVYGALPAENNTMRMITVSGKSPYLIAPSPLMADSARSGALTLTGYADYDLWTDVMTLDCLSSPPNQVSGPNRWTSKISWQVVDTPVYKGEAVLNNEFEMCTPEQEAQDSSVPDPTCIHEKWYFAPGVGIVEVNAIWQATDMKRIN